MYKRNQDQHSLLKENVKINGKTEEWEVFRSDWRKD